GVAQSFQDLANRGLASVPEDLQNIELRIGNRKRALGHRRSSLQRNRTERTCPVLTSRRNAARPGPGRTLSPTHSNPKTSVSQRQALHSDGRKDFPEKPSQILRIAGFPTTQRLCGNVIWPLMLREFDEIVVFVDREREL